MRRREDLPEDDLLRLAAKGDEEAFVCLYRRHQGAIYRYALRMTGSAGSAEEITQDVFFVLAQQPKRYDINRGELGAFLFGIARNLVRKHWDHARPELSLESEQRDGATQLPDTQAADPGILFARNQTAAQVRAAVMSLPGDYREVIVLCELEEKSYEEAAKLLDCPVGTVRSRVHRARALLMAKLEVLRGRPPRAMAQ
jgi:RNA polymerase sigma-70 factor (ECF subfamily)